MRHTQHVCRCADEQGCLDFCVQLCVPLLLCLACVEGVQHTFALHSVVCVACVPLCCIVTVGDAKTVAMECA